MKRTHQVKLIALAILINLLITGCDESSVSNYNVVWDSSSADFNVMYWGLLLPHG